MKMIKLLAAAAVTLSALTTGSVEADARTYIRVYKTAYPISFDRNYGPGPLPGTYAFYDGPTWNHCAQSAAAYRGQDGRRHPCN
jgi:hypothetical protein